MLFNTGTHYWLASRFVTYNSNFANFGLRFAGSPALNGTIIFYSRGTTYTNSHHVRPIISLGADIRIEACEGENSTTNMHEINK